MYWVPDARHARPSAALVLPVICHCEPRPQTHLSTAGSRAVAACLGRNGGQWSGMAFAPVRSQHEQFGVFPGGNQCRCHGVAGEKFLRHGQARARSCTQTVRLSLPVFPGVLDWPSDGRDRMLVPGAPGVLDSHSDRQLLSFPGSVSPQGVSGEARCRGRVQRPL